MRLESQEDQESFLEEVEPLDMGVGRDNSRNRRSCEQRCQTRHARVFMLRKESNLSEHGTQKRDRETSLQFPLNLFDFKVHKKLLTLLCPLAAHITNG